MQESAAAPPAAVPPALRADLVAMAAEASEDVDAVVDADVVAVVDVDAEEVVDADVLPTKVNGFLLRNSDAW